MKTLGFHPDIPLFVACPSFFPVHMDGSKHISPFFYHSSSRTSASSLFFYIFSPRRKGKNRIQRCIPNSMSFTSGCFLSFGTIEPPPEREAAFTEISSRAAIFMNRVSPTMDTSDRRSAPGNILFTQTCKRVHTYRLFDAEGANYSAVEPSRELNRRRKFEERERGREKERLGEGRNNTRIYAMFVFLDDQVFFSPPLRFILYPAFWSQTLFVFCSHFCAGTIVYKSFDSARKKKEKREKKKREKKEETVEIEK